MASKGQAINPPTRPPRGETRPRKANKPRLPKGSTPASRLEENHKGEHLSAKHLATSVTPKAGTKPKPQQEQPHSRPAPNEMNPSMSHIPQKPSARASLTAGEVTRTTPSPNHGEFEGTLSPGSSGWISRVQSLPSKEGIR